MLLFIFILSISHSRIPRRCAENDTSTLKSNKTSRTSPSNPRHNIRQSTSFGNLTDEQSMEFIYRTADRRNGNLIKRTKSFWKFGKSDDEILEGMAMWRHRDLVQTDNEKSVEKEREATLKRMHKKNLEKSTSISTNSSETLKNVPSDSRHDLTLILDDGSKYPLTKSDIDQRISQQQQHEEQIYGRTETRPVRQTQKVVSRSKVLRQSYMEMEQEENKYNKNTENKRVSNSKQHPQPVARTNKPTAYNDVPTNDRRNGSPKISANQDIIEFYDTRHLEPVKLRKHAYSDADLDDSIIMAGNPGRHNTDNTFFDDESVNGEVVMKTVNRQEILKQYYSSGTDTERHSASSSDPYDCIVVEDHLVQKENEKNKQSNPKMEFTTFRGDDKVIEQEKSRATTLLPRTKLTKTSSKERAQQQDHKRDDDYMQTNEKKRERVSDRTSKNRNGDLGRSDQERKKSNGQNGRSGGNHAHLDSDSNKSYGPWYDLWGRDASVNQ